MLSVDNVDFDEADVLVDRVAFALADDDALLVGDALGDALAEDVPEAEEVAEAEDTAACADGELMQVVFGVGWLAARELGPCWGWRQGTA